MRRHILCLRPPRCALQMCKPMGDADSERPNARHAISSDRASKGTMAWAEAQQRCIAVYLARCHAAGSNRRSRNMRRQRVAVRCMHPRSRPSQKANLLRKGLRGLASKVAKEERTSPRRSEKSAEAAISRPGAQVAADALVPAHRRGSVQATTSSSGVGVLPVAGQKCALSRKGSPCSTPSGKLGTLMASLRPVSCSS